MVLNLLPGGPMAPGTLATGWSCSNSLAGPSSSVLVGLPAVPANMASRQLSELFYGSEFILSCNQACARLCQPNAWQQGPLCCGQLLVLNPPERRVLGGRLGVSQGHV